MSKRQIESDSDIDVSSTDESDNELGHQGNGGDRDVDMQETVNVDFDFFDLNPDVDFHALKNFLRQLFGDDHGEFDTSGIADLILAKNGVGTTIKTEGQESDPYALLSVFSISNNLTQPSVKQLVEYVLKQTRNKLEFNVTLKKLLQPNTSGSSTSSPKVGLIVSERLINMPIEVVPPMYKMLSEEMQKADNANERFNFDYFLIISKVYQLVDAVEKDDVDDDDVTNKGKKRKTGDQKPAEFDYFHLEDQILEANATYKGVFDYKNKNQQETDSRRVFTDYGIDPKLSIILISKDNLAKSVTEMEQQFPAP
ncbi:BCP1 [Candida theae]|uniref:Protein BCP1 n=1 Tax=Candida theae TaxID=1198502 RepID=A0AAD5FWT3_9ASCO|nr:BCP1 [Candida theae]KAI5949777.1 BCP1 [Candida theae]